MKQVKRMQNNNKQIIRILLPSTTGAVLATILGTATGTNTLYLASKALTGFVVVSISIILSNIILDKIQKVKQ